MRKTILALLIAIFIPFNMLHAQTEQPVVRAVLFYSPTCGHCEFVINQTILPMTKEYGDQLQVIGIDVTQQDGQALFWAYTQSQRENINTAIWDRLVNFLEYPRVVIIFKQKAGLVRDVSFSTRHPETVIKSIMGSISSPV
jgi:thiol-disulfide isomerase/thioredoxin